MSFYVGPVLSISVRSARDIAMDITMNSTSGTLFVSLVNCPLCSVLYYCVVFDSTLSKLTTDCYSEARLALNADVSYFLICWQRHHVTE